MKKRILSLILVFMMVMSSIPLNVYATEEFKAYTAEQLVEQGNIFYNTTKKNDTTWSPSSLTAFTVKAAGLGDPSMPDESAYDYFKGTHQRLKDSVVYRNNYSLSGLIDRIWDQLAMEADDSEIKPNITELLSKQNQNGVFSTNASEHAKSILVLDAYYGLDFDEEWPDCKQGEGHGRISAVKALLNTSGSLALWNQSNNYYNGAFLNLSTVPAIAPYGFQSLSGNKTLMSAFPLMALSNYAEHPQIGQDVRNTISNTMAGIESAYTSTSKSATYNDAINIIPALIALDGIEINPDYLQKLGGKSTGDDNKVINSLELIETYKLLYGLTYQISNKLPQDDGSFNYSSKFGIEASEYFTQMAVIAGSDILAGETAYKRITGTRAKALEKVKYAVDDINISSYIEVNSESIQGGNNTANINLPNEGLNGTSITWNSSNPSVISDEGLVTFPEIIAESVTMTAIVSLSYDDNKTLEKTKEFIVEVESRIIGEAGELLNKNFAYINANYGKDITSLGWDGVTALSEAGQDISDYNTCELSEETTVEVFAQNIIQLVLIGQNPYDYNNTDYVAELKAMESEYLGNPLVLIALDAVGESASDDFIAEIKAKTITGSSIGTYSLAVNALTIHGEIDATSPSAITTTSSAISLKTITENYTDFVQNVQDNDGMFGENMSDHAKVISALTALGVDVFSKEFTKGNNTVIDPVKNSEESDLNSLKILGNIISNENLWQRIQLTRDDFNSLVENAQDIYETGQGKFSPSSLQNLTSVLSEAEKVGFEDLYGESYYKLKAAINSLSTDMLPEFMDLDNYTEESVFDFNNSTEELYNFLKTKTASVSEAKDYAEAIVDAYSKLVPKTKSLASVNMLTNTLANSYALTYDDDGSILQSEEMAPTQKEAARILEKTSKAFDEEYGLDVSALGYWGVFEVCAMGKDISKYKVYDVTNHKNGLLSIYQATDFAAIILQLVLTGENPYDYNGVNYVDWLLKEEQIENGEGNGNFGPYANNIWALMALGAVGEHNEKLVKSVTGMAKQGQWADTEAWALATIQNYKDEISEAEYKLILSNFNDYIKKQGTSNWTYGNSFTHGCVITGLAAAGVDLTSEEWTASGLNMLTSLEKNFQTEDGQFIVGDNMDPGFVKDAIIGLGDAAQGSNVWQRTFLDQDKLDAAISKGVTALANASDEIPQYKKDALESAIDNVKAITEINGNGNKYFRLLEAIDELQAVELPEFTDMYTYTYDTYSPFEAAVKKTALVLLQSKATASDLNKSCQEILTTYDALKEKGTNPTDPGSNNKITVTFKLLGATKHGGNGTVQTLKNGNLKTWISKTTVEVPESSTVYDVFTKILDEKGYQYIGAEDNYVSYIITPDGVSLGEFDNGDRSGWMYTVNGKHPGVGLTAYTLEDGDDIVWHYTDDYNIEEGSEKWNSGSSGTATDDSGVKLEISTEKNESGVAIAELTSKNAKTFAEAIGKLENKNGISAKLEVKLPKEANGLKVIIPESIMKALKDKDSLSLEISSDMWGVSIEAQVLKSIIEQYGTKDLAISFIKTDISNMSEETKVLIGERTVYDISLYSNGQYMKSFGDGELTCHIPYDAGKEDATKLGIYRIKEDGTPEKIKDCNYDEKGKVFEFRVTSLSNFAVGYDDSIKISFIDIPDGHWAEKYIVNLAQKGIINGKAENIFAPNDSITRAEFVAILARMSNEDLSKYTLSKFGDVNNNDWFSNSITWASENGIAMGYNGKFDPQEKVDRQDMAVMLIRYMENIEKGELTKENGKTVFNDDGEISEYAKSAVYSMAEGGVISGKTDGIFDPTAPATRAEAAKMIDLIMLQINK